jgi:hypothetical protein
MQKRFQQLGSKTFKLKFSSNISAKITINTSFDNQTKIFCDYSNENILFSEKVSSDDFVLEIIDPEYYEKTRNFFKTLSEKNSFLDMAKEIFAILANEETIPKKIDIGGLNLTIELAKNTDNLILNVNNCDIHLDNLVLKELVVHANNANCCLNTSIKIIDTKIVGNNSKIELPLNSITKKMVIKANNGTVLFNRSKEFDGTIRIKGNNTETSGNLIGNDQNSEVKCKMNNGKVIVTLIPEIEQYTP